MIALLPFFFADVNAIYLEHALLIRILIERATILAHNDLLTNIHLLLTRWLVSILSL